MPIKLTPGQSVFLHGWWAPRPSLNWTDVAEKGYIDFDRCRAANLSLRQLHALQPSIGEWVRFGGVQLRHATEMRELWDVHPLRDLRADLADLLALRWGSETLRSMGVSYSDLVEVGMTPETMRMFGFSLLGWINLGFRREHVASFTDVQINTVFALTRQSVEACFAE